MRYSVAYSQLLVLMVKVLFNYALCIFNILSTGVYIRSIFNCLFALIFLLGNVRYAWLLQAR